MEEINIKDFFSYLTHYILGFIIILIIAVSGVIIYNTSFKKPLYQAQTTIVIARSDSANTGDSTTNTLNDINMSQKLATTYSEIAKSELVINQVIDNLGLNTTVKELSRNLSVEPVDNTAILSIKVKNENAHLSATIANEFATVFSEEVKDIYKLDNVTQLSVATTPSAPANDTLFRDVVLAIVITVLLVGGIAFLRFYFDDTVKDTDELEKTIGLPVAGRISRSEIKTKRQGRSELVVENLPKAIVSENIKSLRTNLQFTAVDKTLKTILITSTNASEGKSFVAANLAISFAQADKHVLLVDCDLRKGRTHRLFNISNSKGLSNLLANDLRGFSKYIHSTEIKNLDVITCGTYPPNPSELLASKKNKHLIKILRDFYDIIIFDGAPIGGLADSVILSSLVDGTLVVVKDSCTSKKDLIAVKNSLDKVESKILGLVINMTNHRSSKYYNYYYGDSKKNN